MEPVATAGAFAVALGLVEVVKLLVAKISPNGRRGRDCPLDAGAAIRKIHRMSEIVTRVDQEGAPLIYGTAGHRALLAELQQMNAHLVSINKGVNGGTGRQ